MTLRDSAASGNRLAALRDLRDVLADQIMLCESPRDLAALSRQLTDVLQQIDAATPAKPKGDAVDEITARRAARGAGATTGQARSGKGAS